MVEDFLHYVWQFQQFDKTNLLTTDGQIINILKNGQKNHDSGPDFSQARILIGDIEWVGQVEIHVNAKEWFAHNHQNDLAYDNVILHVVWESNTEITRANNTIIPTLELKTLVAAETINKYKILVDSHQDIKCESFFSNCSLLTKITMLDKALAHRLEKKTKDVIRILNVCKNDWEETTYRILAKNFGFKLNSDAFLRLAELLPLKILQKHRGSIFQIEALCFGQAGFLEEHSDDYSKKLQEEYLYLSKKYDLYESRMVKHEWKFLRTRLPNFPTVRLSQFAVIIDSLSSLFSFFIQNANKEDFEKVLKILPSNYWQEHYDFAKASKNKLKGMGQSSIENVIINTSVNLLAAYSQATNSLEYNEKAVAILEKIKPEKNYITDKWIAMGLEIKSSFDSQAVIEQYNEFCLKKRCLHCAIGVSYLKN
jgi:Protein of unknown function (DUF2851)